MATRDGHPRARNGLEPGKAAGVGLLLARDDAAAVKVVVLDPSSDAVLAESPELPVKLGI